jgi:hypothetical protein
MTVVNLKPAAKAPDASGPGRKNLAAAIALHAGARRDLRIADEAASLAAQKCWEAQSRLEKLREGGEPSGSRADKFIASIAAGAPCDTVVLERSLVEARSKISAAENDSNVWDQTREECDLAAREKEAGVAVARDRVERCACVVIANPETVNRLGDELEALHAEIIERRSELRFLARKGVNDLPRSLKDRIDRLLWRDLLGMESTSASAAWEAAYNALMSDAEAELPS